ncbi:MAG: bifunctional 4-hydroxy-2-oxoglutarate aldolase/2-dehydro-3-deoxy-phosphogluconate aldolase [Pirellulaceae bacterium]|jgi:2-dehydro-3-deoxyphosphogluconate aldolase/(4S)-4-hydroxy-2-oxoglutarate aldolase|nr:bifunctional 4-hydroxy-2-oxoglutarate aldolase/2-dehydro-3-deoxy-phosphogluconate aldolase [Pirellulaceae bacterium]
MTSSAQFPAEVRERIERCGVIAVLVIDHVKDAVPVARALLDGGIDVMELTLRTSAALDALAAIRREVPAMLAGIGTILTPHQVIAVHAAGAAFGVAPGLNRRVVEVAQAAGLPFAPGVATPSELEAALELGALTMKFFPVEPLGGLDYLRAVAGPYLHRGVRFIPLGGVKLEHVGPYLMDPLVLAVGGSWLAPRPLIHAADWLAIRELAATARRQVDQLRGKD